MRLKLYKGNIITAGRTSPYSLYREDLATFGQEDVYDQSDAKGFIAAPEAGKHDDPEFGTHHARDAYHLFQTVGQKLDLFFGGTLFFWLILLFVTPVLTMRLVSEELRSGSIEVLMTARWRLLNGSRFHNLWL